MRATPSTARRPPFSAAGCEIIDVAKDGPIGWLTLTWPRQLNAITPAVSDERKHYFRSIASSEDTRIVVVRAPLGLRLSKDLLNASAAGGSLEEAIAMEDRSQVLCSASGNPAEGMRAFIEKRDPEYG